MNCQGKIIFTRTSFTENDYRIPSSDCAPRRGIQAPEINSGDSPSTGKANRLTNFIEFGVQNAGKEPDQSYCLSTGNQFIYTRNL